MPPACSRPKPRPTAPTGEINEAIKTLGQVAEAWLSTRTAAPRPGQAVPGVPDALGHDLSAPPGPEGRSGGGARAPGRPFSDAEWSSNPYFDFIKQGYLIATRWAESLVDEAQGIDEHTRHKAQFYLRQLTSMLSPSNFLPTNPELIRHTLQESGANLVRGLKMYEEDLAAGGGQLRVRQTDPSGFEVGRNIAVTPARWCSATT